MKRVTLAVVVSVLLAAFSFGQAPVTGGFQASDYASFRFKISQGNSTTGSPVTYTLQTGCFAMNNGRTICPLNTNAPLIIDQETLTPSAVSGCSNPNQPYNQCQITVTPSTAHGQGSLVVSGTYGLQEAINDAKTANGGGGLVVTSAAWAAKGGTTAMITNAVNLGNTVAIEDLRTGGPIFYSGTGNNTAGSGTVQTIQPPVTTNGAAITYYTAEELLPLSTGGTTTDTVGNLLHANSVLDSVTATVTTAISGGTCTAWGIGDATTPTRFTPTTVALAAGTKSTTVIPGYLGAGIGSATTGTWQTAAAKVRVTCATGAPGAGTVRIAVIGHTLQAPLQ